MLVAGALGYASMPQALLAAGKTILLTTHFMEEAERLCDELCVIDNGRKIAQGKPHELIAREIGCDVVEVYGDDLTALRALLTPLADRVESSGETLFCYARDPQPLVAALRAQTESHTMPGLRYLHRPANLEDVFLRLTGREMRD
jgi:lipooligosaccharide transport system ATP-binding protein